MLPGQVIVIFTLWDDLHNDWNISVQVINENNELFLSFYRLLVKQKVAQCLLSNNPVDGTLSFTRTLDIAHTLLSVFSLSLELVLIPLIFVQKSQPFSINWKRKLADKFNLHTIFFFCTFMSTKLKRTLLLFILWTKTFTNGFLKLVLFYSFVCLRRLAKFV